MLLKLESHENMRHLTAVPFFFQKNQLFFKCCKIAIFNFSAVFFKFFIIETLDPDPLEMLDPDLMNPDPQHWIFLIFVANLLKGG
jgi:hypothetical protein